MERQTRRVAQRTAAIALIWISSLAIAEVRLIDRETAPDSWVRATKSLRVHGAWNLAELPDFGVTSAPGPLTSQGGGPVPAGLLPDSVSLDATRFFPLEPIALAFVGPSANGMDNIYNAIIPNQPQDALVISFLRPVYAFEFDAISCANCEGGSGTIDITVEDNRGERVVFSGVAAPPSGNLYGLVASKGRAIVSVVLSGPAPVPPGESHHFPGIQGAAAYYGHGKPKQ